ncbi:MAG: hypothetical protein F4Y01_14730 [Gammaproteobacteria bacterium]|nr:hypothetical protein [Gammaproteobacteria bacterium]
MGRRTPFGLGAGSGQQSWAERRDLGARLQAPSRYKGTGRHTPVPCRDFPRTELGGLVERIAATRGAGIAVLRASELVIRDPDGNARRIGQNSQVVFTSDATKCAGEPVVIDRGEFPGVVLQAGDTAVAVRRKLSLYEKCGLPEVWVVGPDRRGHQMARRWDVRIAIYLRTRLGYVRAPRSAALPSWSAAEIQTALNEPEGFMSDGTIAALRRVGRLMRADADMGPDDDSVLPAERGELRAEPTMEDRIDALDEIFGLRGFAVSHSFTVRVAALRRPLPYLLRAAYESRDEDDFLERIGVVREIPLVLDA